MMGLHHVNQGGDQRNLGVVEHVLGLLYRSPIVIMLKVGLHYGCPRMVKLEVGFHRRYPGSDQEMF